MTASNPSTRWGRAVVDELANAGIRNVCIAPGSRSTPIVVAAAEHADLTIHSILDERSAAYFALGRGKRTGRPTAMVTTSGTATANVHPAVIEADRSRTPLIVCTADRPPELIESGANQTIHQRDLYGDAVRWAPTVPPPAWDERGERALRMTVRIAVARSRAPVPGPVHLNLPFRKPLSPAEADSPASEATGGAPTRRAFDVGQASTQPDPTQVGSIADAIDDARRGLLVAGPVSGEGPPAGLRALSAATGFPLLADPISGVRFGGDAPRTLGAYDAFLDPQISGEWPAPDLVIRVGGPPTSTHLQEFVARHEGQHVLVDPAIEYRDPTFSATDLVPASPAAFLGAVLERVEPDGGDPAWGERFVAAESAHWELVASTPELVPPEGRVAHEVFGAAPSGATVFVSSSMPIRDVDRFARPSPRAVTALGNRGASGIDGILSTGLGATSASAEDGVILAGDLAFYHDMNGLLSIDRCDVDATIVVVNNDGGGIFHKLPIADVDPPFTEQFKTPHGLDFSHAAALYGLEHTVATPETFSEVYDAALAADGSTVVEVTVDAEDHHRIRAEFQQRLGERLPAGG